jgi:hypothetical protein
MDRQAKNYSRNGGEMFKILVFMESDLARIEPELNQYADEFEIAYVWSTNIRLVFILKEKAKRGRPPKEQ